MCFFPKVNKAASMLTLHYTWLTTCMSMQDCACVHLDWACGLRHWWCHERMRVHAAHAQGAGRRKAASTAPKRPPARRRLARQVRRAAAVAPPVTQRSLHVRVCNPEGGRWVHHVCHVCSSQGRAKGR